MNPVSGWQVLHARLVSMSRSSDLMLVLSGLLQRGFGFLASLAMARQVGLDAVGLYTSLQISSNSLTSPLSAPLANSATLVATEHRNTHSLQSLMAAHVPALALTSALAALGTCILMQWSASQTVAWQHWPAWVPLLFVSLLSVSFLGSQFMAGLFHGVDRSLPLARVTMAATVVGILLCWPVATHAGIVGALALSVGVVAVPGLWLAVLAMRHRAFPPSETKGLSQAVWLRIWQALPNVASTLIRNGANWFCCIYLAQLHHGPAGVGLVTIGLQWMMLMQLPTMAWGGRMVADMGQAQQQSPLAMRQATLKWLRQCCLSTALIGLGVAAVSTWIARMYHLEDSPLHWVLVANAVVSLLMAATFVQERAFFCQARQRAWFVLSLLGDAVQVAVTLQLAHHSVLVISLGSVASALLVFVGGQWMLHRHQPLIDTPS
jgi:O-antigen/teichoic acid export membrane protein